MNYWVGRISKAIKGYDSSLFCVKNEDGSVHIRRKVGPESALHQSGSSGDQSLFILALTDTWHVTGRPVERGVEQVMLELRSRDSWAQDKMFEEMKRRREANESDMDRARRNEIRAIAADVRKDFARETNDIVVRS